MTLPLTEKARLTAQSNQLTVNMVLDIDGVTDKFGVVPILRFVRLGDDELVIGDDWSIGGYTPLPDQQTVVSFDGSSSSINQKLDIDKGSGSSVSQLSVALIDIDEAITQLITPGEIVDDVLGRDATVWIGFGDNAFPDDYIRIFRGIIDDINSVPGKITLQISHPDQKKRQDIFIKAESKLDGAIGSGDTSINLLDAINFFEPITGPDGLEDSKITYGLRIEDEIVFYTGITGDTLTGVTRGALGTTAVAHDDQQDVEAFIRFGPINAMEAALKIMCSGWNGPYQEDVEIKNFNVLGDLTTVTDAAFFEGVDVTDEYGIVVGDYMTITGAANSENNIAGLQITEFVKTIEGSYVVVDGAGFVYETMSSAVASFRSQYDTLHPGAGLKLHNKEVDITQHELINRWFLSSFEYDFYIRDTWPAKDFLEQQIYFPAAAYSLPRKARASVGFHIGPLPTSDVKVIDTTNTVNADKTSIRRSIAKNFYNTIIYKIEEKVLEEDKYLRGDIEISAASKNRIKVGTRALVIPSKGMREILSGLSLALNSANRRLRRYKFAAEYVEGLQVTLGYSYNVEIGDIIVLDLADLQMSDTKNASRSGKPRLFEIYNKTFDIKTGNVKLALLDTAYSTQTRYFLMSPSSRIGTGSTTTKIKLVETGNSVFGPDEGAKWSRYIGATVRVRSDDYTTHNDTAVILSVLGNTVTLDAPLSFTPVAGECMVLANYNDVTGEISDRLKLIYGWMRDTPFDDSTQQYQMI